jgi:hypothetical protein
VRDSTDNVVLSDDFDPEPPDPLLPWASALGTWTVTDGVPQGLSEPSEYAFVYNNTQWADYTVEGRVHLPAEAFGGGIGAHVNLTAGSHYGAWIYPDGSWGGSNVLKFVEVHSWTQWSGTPMQQVSLPDVSTSWHTLAMALDGSRIRVCYDGDLMIDIVDENYDSITPYLSGVVSADTSIPSGYNGAYTIRVDDIVVRGPSQ